MVYKKCPKCNLNYINENEDFCGICVKELENLRQQNNVNKINANKQIENGECFYCRTNAELLNRLLGTNFRQWMKAFFMARNKDSFLWIVSIDGSIQGEWINKWANFDTRIIEKYVGSLNSKPNNFFVGVQTKTRLVFEKYGNGADRFYVFRGTYQLSSVEDNQRNRILEKISDIGDLREF